MRGNLRERQAGALRRPSARCSSRTGSGSRRRRERDGRRRSASISSTRRLYESLNVNARLVAVSVLPSPRRRSPIMTDRTSAHCAWWSAAASRRYCSTRLESTSESRMRLRDDATSRNTSASRSAGAADGRRGWIFCSAVGGGSDESTRGRRTDVSSAAVSSPASRSTGACGRAPRASALQSSRLITDTSKKTRTRRGRENAEHRPGIRRRSSRATAAASVTAAPEPSAAVPGGAGARGGAAIGVARRRAVAEIEIAAHLEHDVAIDRPTPRRTVDQRVVADDADRSAECRRMLVDRHDRSR